MRDLNEAEVLEHQLKRYNQQYWVCLFLCLVNIGIYFWMQTWMPLAVAGCLLLTTFGAKSGAQLTLKLLGRNENER